MSKEFEGSVWGIKGKYKKVESMPVILQPYEHLVTQKHKLFKDSIMDIHGRSNSIVTSKKIEV